MICEQSETIRKSQQRIGQLEHYLQQLLRSKYGPKTERIDPNQLQLFDDDDVDEADSESQTPDESHDSPVVVREHGRPGGGRKTLPDDLPHEIVERNLTDEENRCPDCGEVRQRIGCEKSEHLEFVPAVLKVLAHVRWKYACRPCQKHMAVALESTRRLGPLLYHLELYDEWPYVFVKEAIDNALDACDEAGIAPEISVTADERGITVSDHGHGLPENTLEGAMNFAVRASNREMYVAPDRGAQGNALKTMLSMPYVIDPDQGRLIVTARGVEYTIKCRAEPVSQRVVIDDERRAVGSEPGTTMRIQWSPRSDPQDGVIWPFDDMRPQAIPEWSDARRVHETLLDLVHGFLLFNPHLTLRIDWFGETHAYNATDLDWQKWAPNKPTSPHWYEPSHLGRQIAAYITHDRDNGTDRSVAAFVKEFDGLTGSRKRSIVLEEAKLKRAHLSELANVDGLRTDVIARLLNAMKMKRNTRPVQPKRLGIIGRDHVQACFEWLGCQPASFEYNKTARTDAGIPFVLESAFGSFDDDGNRQLFTGANWSPAIGNPFRSFGQSGQGLEGHLEDLKCGFDEPTIFMLHLAHPRVEYTDRGKSAIVVDVE